MKRLSPGLLWLFGVTAACGGGAGPGPAPARLTASAGDNQVGPAGQPLGAALQVTVLDDVGRPLPGITVVWSPAGGGSVDPTSSTTGSDGTAATQRILGAGAGPQTTTAGVTGIAHVVFSHTAQIQGATQISASGSVTRSDTVLSTVPFAALVRDQNGAPVAGVIVTWSAAGGGALSRALDTTDAAGLTSVTLRLSQTAGPQAAQAAVTGLIGSPVGFTDNAAAGNATQLSPNGGSFQAGPVLTNLPTQHSVLVRDAYGNPKSSALVDWVVGAGGGLVNGSTAFSASTNAFGIASVTRTLGLAAGPHSDTARVASLPGPLVVFSDTAATLATIQIGNDFFSPQLDTVPAGSFLKFIWVAGGTLHNVTWDSGDPAPLPPNSPNQSALNATFTVRVPRTGTYSYHCGFHGGAGTGVFGVVVSH
jgi:plastocyanin